MKRALALLFLIFFATFNTGCSTQDVPAGHKGFMFDRTGFLALYSGGDGLQEEEVLDEGTHFTGIYDHIQGVNCRDAHVKEPMKVLTQSDMEVTVDLRVTYSADCSSNKSMLKLVNKVGPAVDSRFVQPPQVFEKYVMPTIRESLRNHLAASTLEEVKNVRGELALAVKSDLEKTLEEKGFPVQVDVLTVSKISLPKAITAKIKEIEVARMEANKETEKQRASKVRLERELFEAQQQREVSREMAEKEKEVATIKAEADLEIKKREAEGIKEIRQQLTGNYLEYLSLLKGAEVQHEFAKSLKSGTKWYIDKDFLIPPGSAASVSVGK